MAKKDIINKISNKAKVSSEIAKELCKKAHFFLKKGYKSNSSNDINYASILYMEAVKNDPDFIEPYIFLAYISLSASDLEKATFMLKKAKAIDKNNSDIKAMESEIKILKSGKANGSGPSLKLKLPKTTAEKDSKKALSLGNLFKEVISVIISRSKLPKLESFSAKDFKLDSDENNSNKVSEPFIIYYEFTNNDLLDNLKNLKKNNSSKGPQGVGNIEFNTSNSVSLKIKDMLGKRK